MSSKFAQYYADSVNALRPTWVDTAMLELDRLEPLSPEELAAGFCNGMQSIEGEYEKANPTPGL